MKDQSWNFTSIILIGDEQKMPLPGKLCLNLFWNVNMSWLLIASPRIIYHPWRTPSVQMAEEIVIAEAEHKTLSG